MCVVPKGVWGPDDVSKQSSFFFDDFRENQWKFKVWQLFFSHAIVLVGVEMGAGPKVFTSFEVDA